MAALFVSLADYHYVCKFYVLFYFINMGLLLYTKFAGKSYHQAQRWIIIGGDGGITLMPSELTKVLLILFTMQEFGFAGTDAAKPGNPAGYTTRVQITREKFGAQFAARQLSDGWVAVKYWVTVEEKREGG